MSRTSNIASIRCRGCGDELTPANDSEAHVIPNALGGRLKLKGIICRTCNGALDRIADNRLVKAFGDWPTLMDIPRDRGVNPPKVIETRDGKRVRLEPGGTLTRVDVVYNITDSDGASKIEIGAGDMKTIRQLLQRVKKDRPEFDATSAENYARAVGIRDDDELKMHLGFGRAQVFGGVVTAVWLFLIMKTGRAFMDLSKLRQVISDMHDHGGTFRYLPKGLPGLNGPEISLGHKIVVRSVPATGELIAYVEILGILRIGGIFASAGGPAAKIEHVYAFDLLSGADRSTEFSIDPVLFERQDWRKIGLGPTIPDTPALTADFMKKLENVFVRRYMDRFSPS
jgi:HNH endonuclease